MNKLLTLEQIKNMSIDDTIQLYRQGYVLENNNHISLIKTIDIEPFESDPNCIIPSPFGGCLLSKYAANTVLIVGVLILGGFIAYKLVAKR